jgi:hypothetical protein
MKLVTLHAMQIRPATLNLFPVYRRTDRVISVEPREGCAIA